MIQQLLPATSRTAQPTQPTQPSPPAEPEPHHPGAGRQGDLVNRPGEAGSSGFNKKKSTR